MVELREEPLANHTTLKMGGPAEVLLIPETEDELVSAIQRCGRDGVPWRLLGNGSNVLVRDAGVRGVVIKNTRACRTLRVLDGGEVEAGSSVLLQAFIKFCIAQDLEGLEYLYSVPATVGGAVHQNAGRGKGKGEGLAISNMLRSVRIWDGDSIRTLTKAECAFGYRSSVFQQRKNWIILSARFRLAPQPRAVGEERLRERMEYVKRTQDWTLPSAGSVFSKGYPFVFDRLKGRQVGAVRFSTKTRNWIQNLGGASASDAVRLIKQARWMHRLLALRAKLELEIW